jgi:hypothetical protein
MLHRAHPRRSFLIIYLTMFLLSLSYAATIYIDSNFLSGYFASQMVDALYLFGAAGSLFGLAAGATIIRRWSNFSWLSVTLVAEAVALFGLTQARSPLWIGIFFVVHQMLPPLALFSFDVLLEQMLDTQTITGRVRSLYLTSCNVAFVTVPFFVGTIAQAYSYRVIYATAGILIAVVIALTDTGLNHNNPTRFRQVSFTDSLYKLPARRGLLDALGCNFLLQCFYALMTIFTPLYLHVYIGFEWTTVGLILAIMLLPFLIFEAPLGQLFDRFRIERDTLMTGFMIMSAACVTMYYLNSHDWRIWALWLFVSRIGASFVEISSEYSFFRRINGSDAGFVSVFHAAVPLSYVAMPLALAAMNSGAPQNTFLAMAGVTFIGIFSGYLLPPRPRKV